MAAADGVIKRAVRAIWHRLRHAAPVPHAHSFARISRTALRIAPYAHALASKTWLRLSAGGDINRRYLIAIFTHTVRRAHRGGSISIDISSGAYHQWLKAWQ